MIEKRFDTTFEKRRQNWIQEEIDGRMVDKSAEVVVGTFKGHLQQTNPEYVASLGLTMTKPFSIWCAIDTDVQDGEVLTSDKGTFNVRGVQRNDNGRNKHLEVICEEIGENGS